MTTLRPAASACGADDGHRGHDNRAAKAPDISVRTFRKDTRWVPWVLSGNRLASFLPERHAWGRATVGGWPSAAGLGGRAGHGRARGRTRGIAWGDPGPGGRSTREARQVPAVTTALRFSCLSAVGDDEPPGLRGSMTDEATPREPRPFVRRRAPEGHAGGLWLVPGRTWSGSEVAASRGDETSDGRSGDRPALENLGKRYGHRWPSTGSTCACRRASSTGSSAPTAPARRRRCGS